MSHFAASGRKPGDLGNRVDDVGVGGAATQIAAHPFADLGVGQRDRARSALAWLAQPRDTSSSMPTAEQICPGVQ